MKTLSVWGLVLTFVVAGLAGCSTPTKVEIIPDKVVIEGAGVSKKLEAKVTDADGKLMTDGIDIVWFSEDTKIFKLTHDGEVTGVASGEGKVQVEVVGTELKVEVPIRVKIPSSINVSHEKLRLWLGQVKDNVWAEVHSEKGAFIEGYLPTWTSEDPSIVRVEQIKDPNRRQSWVKMTGMKSGTTYVNASFQSITKTLRVSVFSEDEEVSLDGTRITKDMKKEKEEKKKGKK
ncbi:MAG: hypothetical protein GY854_15715 [Deltaproteobacteria bacterium]|nr:hypothetical protein [Deltaproteobacteria bacterium]